MDFEQIWSGLIRWEKHWLASRTDEQFIPHPSTWLNQERWNDPCPAIVPSIASTRSQRSMAAIERMAAMSDHPSGFKEVGP